MSSWYCELPAASLEHCCGRDSSTSDISSFAAWVTNSLMMCQACAILGSTRLLGATPTSFSRGLIITCSNKPECMLVMSNGRV